MIINKILDNFGLGEIYYYSSTFFITCYFEFLSTSHDNDIIISSHFIIYDLDENEISLKNTIYAREVLQLVITIMQKYEK
jgi:hypothetical protein